MEAGFTLLELMVVIILIGILTALVVPELKGSLKDARLKAASRELVNVFTLASSRAVSLNQVHRVRLDEKTGRYLLERRVREGRDGPEFEPVADEPGCRGELDSRIAVTIRPPGLDMPPDSAEPGAADSVAAPSDSAQPDALAFYPDGTTDGGNIELLDEDGFRLVLELNPVTARVHVLELARE